MPSADGLAPQLTIDFELAPVVAHLYNSSLMEGYLPELFKCADVRPLPKQMLPMSIENDIRPVSLTFQLAKVMEGFTLSRISRPIINNLDPKQFAVAGKSTSHALAGSSGSNRSWFYQLLDCSTTESQC